MITLPGRNAFSLLLISGALACSPMAPTSPVPAVPVVSGTTPSGELEVGTLTFENLTSNGAAVSEYHERGFALKFGGAGWVEGHTYGNPRPFVFFKVDGGTSATGTVEVSGGGQTFAFHSVDLYSSTTKIPYHIVGLRGGAVAFTLDDRLPNTFGQFRTVESSSQAPIDTLRIALTNEAAPCCPNPMGLDNIVLR
jgi:hypothetical protein